MTPNPYQSPQHAGYVQKPAPLPLWRRVALIIGLVVAIVGWGFFAVVVAIDFCRWRFGF
jgi:hypothetical protein